MLVDDVIQRATEDVADGKPVDWDALAARAQSDDERERLNCLRILGAIAVLHRSGEDPIVGSGESLIASTVGAPDARLDWTGEVWGRYRLVQKVGEGGFGSVYRAWDPELEREVAIKILHRRVADARLREGLLREGRALAKVRDPHVVSVLGVETHEDQIALCMEFVHGQTLEDALQRHGTLNAREAALVGKDV